MANHMAVHNPSVKFFQDVYDDSILLSYKVYSYLKEKHPNNKSSYVKLFKEAYATMLKDDPGNSRLEKYLKETEFDFMIEQLEEASEQAKRRLMDLEQEEAAFEIWCKSRGIK